METKPIFMTWLELYNAMQALHLGEKKWVDALHDVWKQGAPSPNRSIVLNTQVRFDERTLQRGNYVERLVLPSQLARWIMDCSKARGFPYTEKQALMAIQGEG